MTHYEPGDPPPVLSGSDDNRRPTGGLEAPFDQNMRLRMLWAALDEHLAALHHPATKQAQPTHDWWTTETIESYLEDELTLADLRALGRTLKAGLDLTIRFPEGDPVTIKIS